MGKNKIKLGALTSGGKDSLLSLYLTNYQSKGEIAFVLTMLPESSESYMFHYPNSELTKYISQSLEIPLITQKTKGEKEAELKDLEKLLKKAKQKGAEGIISGAIASNYQKSRTEKLCEKLGLKVFSPLWQKSGEEIWNLLFENSFRVMITSVSAYGLGKAWLGREIGGKELLELKKLSEKYRFHLAFEGGEAETLVLDMPLYKKALRIEKAETKWDEKSRTGIFEIKKVRLVEK